MAHTRSDSPQELTRAAKGLLIHIMESKGLLESPTHLGRLARELRIANPQLRGCSYSYLKGVLRGHKGVTASQQLLDALQAVDNMDWQHPLLAAAEEVTIKAPKGAIQPGSYVAGPSRSCPKCGLSFVSPNPLRRYCTICSPPTKRRKRQ